ncbi:MAG: CesT family type III secretion system chaperone [Pseudomonadota bacterium]
MPMPNVDPKTGGYALALGGRYLVHIAEVGSQVAAWAWLADMPEDEQGREEVARRALRAELGLFGRDDVVLSLDEAETELRVHRMVPIAEFDADGMDSLLRDLIGSVERRRAVLGGPSKAPPVPPMIIRP